MAAKHLYTLRVCRCSEAMSDTETTQRDEVQHGTVVRPGCVHDLLGHEFQDLDLAPLSVRLSTQMEEKSQASEYDVLVAPLYTEAVDVSVTGSQQVLFHRCYGQEEVD